MGAPTLLSSLYKYIVKNIFIYDSNTPLMSELLIPFSFTDSDF